MGVEGHADHVQHAVLLGQDVGLPVALAGVGHGGQLQRWSSFSPTMRRMSSSSQCFQAPNWSLAKSFAGVLVADLHVVDAGRRRTSR